MIVELLCGVLGKVEGIVHFDIRGKLSQFSHWYLAEEVFLYSQRFFFVKHITIDLGKVGLDLFLGQFTVCPEKLQIKIPFIKLSHR